jgi:hypothetical protein
MKRLLILLSFCLIGCCEQSSSQIEQVGGNFTEVTVPVDVQRVYVQSKATLWIVYEVTYKGHIFMVGKNESGFIHAPYCPCQQKESSNNLFNPYGTSF